MSLGKDQALYSMLALNFMDSLDNLVDHGVPPVIYRDFDAENHRDNFVKGNIWFSGPSQNRFFLHDEARRDEYEYRNKFGSHIFEYSLSFSTKVPTSNKPAIKICNVEGLIRDIINDLEKSKNDFVHTVSWVSIEELQRHIQSVPAISQINTYPTQDNEKVTLWACGIASAQVKYVPKMTYLGCQFNSPAVASNARKKSVDFIHEHEWRVSFNTGDFCYPYNGIQHLVQYLKLSCPSITKYCELIKC